MWGVGNHRRKGVLAAGLAEHRNDVRALSALADAEHQCIVQTGWAVVDGKETGRCQSYLQAVAGAQDVLRIATSIITRSTRNNDDVGNLASGDGSRQFLHGLAGSVQQLLQRLRLLVNFAKEEGLGYLLIHAVHRGGARRDWRRQPGSQVSITQGRRRIGAQWKYATGEPSVGQGDVRTVDDSQLVARAFFRYVCTMDGVDVRQDGERSPGEAGAAWRVRNYTDGDDEAAVRLYQAVYGRHLSLEDYRWKLVHTPWRLPAPNIWVADAGDRLAGHYAATPLRFKLEDETVIVGHTCDAMTHPAFRRQGVFTNVAQAAHEAWARAGVPFMVGVPNNQWVSRRKPLGYREQFKITWFWRPLRPDRLLAHRLHLPQLPGRLSALTARIWQGVWNLRLTTPHDVQVMAVTCPHPAFDTLWQRLNAHFPALIVRDSAWLTYRYADAPGRDYRIFLASRDNEPQGYIVYRLSREKERKDGWIADLFTAPRDWEVQRALLHRAIQDMQASGVETARILLSPDVSLTRTIRRAGFWPARGAFDASLVALEQSIPDLSDAARWFTMAGDYDIV